MVSADEGHVFHNRLTHSLQVAQVGRRIAEKLIRTPGPAPWASEIDPDVVETACLAHDLGHPPFGHIAEETLDELATGHGLKDGFEGNAQSFRIVTTLAMGSANHGLNLTRASLNAILKYPWLRGQNSAKLDKWGAYESEKDQFTWARELGPSGQDQSLEAWLMDWADDVTYSVHDLDDFFRAGVIPLDRLVVDADERNRFYAEVFARRKNRLPAELEEAYLRGAFDELVTKLPIKKPYQATEDERIRLRSVTSTLIGDYVRAVGIAKTRSGWELKIEKQRRAEIFMLKQLTWHYVIANPALATQQEGQRTIIKHLFRVFLEAATSVKRSSRDLFPIGVRELLPASTSRKQEQRRAVRTIVDFIAGLTEEQAVSTCHRVTGIALGSSLIHKVR